MKKILNIIRKDKWWQVIIVSFLLVRFGIISSFLLVNRGKDVWTKLYGEAQPSQSVFMRLFHDFCDWHPPIYYTFTSTTLFLFRSHLFIYLAQILLAFLSVWIGYKIIRLFFSRKISMIVALLTAIEPYWAFHNFLLVSENIFTPLMLAGFYFLFCFIKSNKNWYLWFSAVFLGFATLTRSNTLIIVPALSLLLLIVFAFRKKIKQENLLELNLKQILFCLIVFNLIFFGILSPWIIRNKIVYGQATLANMLSTNIFFYNLPPLISMQKNISYEDAYRQIVSEAKSHIKEPVDDQGNCELYSKEEFSARQDYYSGVSRKHILSNWKEYAKVHFVKTIPFFFQSGYFEMWSAYSGEYSKPDITGLILKKDLASAEKFFKEINAKLVFYILGIILWGASSFAAFLAVIYSYFKDKEKFLFFLISFVIIMLNALLISPFVLARYRLPINALFFIPLVYMIFEIAKLKFKSKIKE